MSEWKEKVFGEVATVTKGKLTLQSESKEQDYLTLINADVVNGKKSLFGYSKGAVLCDLSDVLMLWDGERSGLVATGLSGVVGSTFAKLSPMEFIDSKYLFYYLDSKFNWIQGQRTGTGIPHVPKNIGKILRVKYPENIFEQQRIAKILSTADAVIEKTQATIAKYKAIKQGMLQDLFTRGIDPNTNRLRPRYEDAPELYKESKLGMIPREWEVEEFQSVCSLITDGSHFSPKPQEDGELIVNVKDIGEYEINYSSCTRITVEDFELLKKQNCSPEEGDILLSKDGTIGKTLLFSGKRKVVLLSSIAILRTSILLNPAFFYTYFKSHHFENELRVKVSGTAIKRIVLKAINTLNVVLPKSLKEQKLIAQRIKAIDNKLQTEQIYLHKMQSIKRGLMEDLLSGKKRVKINN